MSQRALSTTIMHTKMNELAAHLTSEFARDEEIGVQRHASNHGVRSDAVVSKRAAPKDADVFIERDDACTARFKFRRKPAAVAVATIRQHNELQALCNSVCIGAR
jgi:hypothetical protein